MGTNLSDDELQSIYDTVQKLLFNSVSRIETSANVLKYANAPCTVSSAATTREYDQTAQEFVYEGNYRVSFPKWVDIDASDIIYVLGVKLSVKTLEFPVTGMASKTVVAIFEDFDDTYTTGAVAPFDSIWTTVNNKPLTTYDGELLII